jgi:hypothetical protein
MKTISLLVMDFKIFKILLTVELVLLFVQFYLGMTVNLFVSLPSTHPMNFSSYSGGSYVYVHIINGLLALAIAALILSYSFRLKNAFISVLSVVALTFAVVAAATGYAFVLGGQNNSLSMSMAVSFLIIYTIYLAEFYLVGKLKPAAPS